MAWHRFGFRSSFPLPSPPFLFATFVFVVHLPTLDSRLATRDSRLIMTQSDIVIRGGHVIDPSQALSGVRDVAIRDGKIQAIEPNLAEPLDASDTIDARGLYVVPGLIDLHLHVYPRHVPLGLDPDPLCPAGGVTTMLDTGSAGTHNYEGFQRDVVARAETQIFALVNLSRMGLVLAPQVGELLDRHHADPAGVVKTISRYPESAVGVKIRASKNIIGEGEIAWANFRDAVSAARDSGTWLMVHIGDSPMSIPEMLEHLEPGDCITHCFKSGPQRILDPSDSVFPAVKEAAGRGVIFDVGHGFGSFCWEVAEAALQQGLEPTTISTDLHTMNIHGPVYDMPTTMSKFLHLGLPLDRVIELSTTRPATALKRQDQLGTLKPSTVADVAILEKRQGRFVFTDSYGTQRIGDTLLSAAATIRRGVIVPGGGGLRMRHLPD